MRKLEVAMLEMEWGSAESDDDKVGDGDSCVKSYRSAILGLTLNFFSTVMKCSTVFLALSLSS